METLALKKSLSIVPSEGQELTVAESASVACLQLLDQLRQKQQLYQQILQETSDTEVQTIVKTADQAAELQLLPILTSCVEQ